MKVAGWAGAARGCPGGANARPRTATRLHSGPSNRPRWGANHEPKGNRSAKRVGRQRVTLETRSTSESIIGMHLLSGLVHPACGHSFAIPPDVMLSYFGNSVVNCDFCEKEIDVWDAIRHCFVGAGATFSLLAPLRGFTLMAPVRLHRDQVAHIKLQDYGVKPGALIRGINFTGTGGDFDQGFLIPALIFGNEMRLARLPEELGISLAPIGDNPPEFGDFNMSVQFIAPEPELHRRLLIEAAYAHGDGDYRRAVIDAHTALDSLLQAVVPPILKSTPARKLDLGFLEKVRILSALRSAAGAPELADKLTNNLVALNTHRNKVAHPPGKVELTQELSADLLTAALLLIELLESNGGVDRALDSPLLQAPPQPV